jgi:hypothetical protein
MSDGFEQPYVDVDEWRDAPVRHRYVHGGFTGTDTRFSFYFPPPERYGGRFFQHVTPVPDSEHLAQGHTGAEDKIGFSIASGAYFVETNGGGQIGRPGSSVDPTIGAFRANAASAEHSRVVAAAMYGEHRPWGYLYGGSGGGFRTMGSAENTTGVWDGFVPYVIGSPMAIPNMFTARMHAQRILADRFDQIVDAVEPGGSGDMYAGLDEVERQALTEVTRMGFPPRSWFGHRTMGMHAFPVLYGGVRRADPSYFDDFWTQPGYLGHDEPEALAPYVVQHPCTVVATIDEDEADALGLGLARQPGRAAGVDESWKGGEATRANLVAVRLSSAPTTSFLGADLVVLGGDDAGTRLLVVDLLGDIAVFGPVDRAVVARLQPGDAVELDNRGFLAAQTYHRHQVPDPTFAGWDQFRDDDGEPRYPQRPMILGPLFASAASGTVQSGRFAGRMIVVESLLDREAMPWQADWYRARVEEHLGSELDDRFRLWFTDNALHGDDQVQEDPTHAISYLGVLHQALRDVSAWVERGVEPPASTSYEVVDAQVVVPDDAAARRGVQPVVALRVDGGERADVEPGTEVHLVAEIAVPPGTGSVVSVEWDLDGTGTFAVRTDVEPAESVTAELRHTYTSPGTHFATVRVASQRDGDATTPFARIENLARARVVVR